MAGIAKGRDRKLRLTTPKKVAYFLYTIIWNKSNELEAVLNRLGHRKRFSLCPKIKDYRHTEPCRLSVGVVVAHVSDKCLILFIFIPGEDNWVGKPDNLVSLGVSNQDAIKLMPFFILFHLQLHRLVVAAG